jgi:hypothetical protein
MEQIHISEKKRILEEIKHLRECKINELDIIDRIMKAPNSSFNQRQILKLNESIKNRILNEDVLEKRLTLLFNGELDEELLNKMKKNTNTVSKKVKDKIKKENDISNWLSVNSKKSKIYANNISEDRKKHFQSMKEIDKSYKTFCANSSTIPFYISRNLKEMPSNKGYIWKNIFCFGELEDDKSGVYVMFDKKNANLLVIHEWTSTEYNKYEKIGKNKKILVEKVFKRR